MESEDLKRFLRLSLVVVTYTLSIGLINLVERAFWFTYLDLVFLRIVLFLEFAHVVKLVSRDIQPESNGRLAEYGALVLARPKRRNPTNETQANLSKSLNTTRD